MNHSDPPHSHENERLRQTRQLLRQSVRSDRNVITFKAIIETPRIRDEPMFKWAKRIIDAYKD